MMHLFLGETRAAYWGPGLNLEPHTNAVTTLAISLGGAMQLRTMDKRGRWQAFESRLVALIPGGVLHHLKADSASNILFVYLDPCHDSFNDMDESRLLRCREALLDCDPDKLSLEQIERSLGLVFKRGVSSRVSRVIEAMDRNPSHFNTLEQAAAIVNLSGSRFRALFAQQVGLPFRRYRLWRRMAHVVSKVARGRNLTDACLDAGFSDSAHLSASFKAMFGIQPSFLLDPRVRIHLSAFEFQVDSHLAYS